jgi:hypothetical protein
VALRDLREVRRCVRPLLKYCKWLNTCIGVRNDAFFRRAIHSCAVMVALQCGVAGYLLWRYAADDGGFVARVGGGDGEGDGDAAAGSRRGGNRASCSWCWRCR